MSLELDPFVDPVDETLNLGKWVFRRTRNVTIDNPLFVLYRRVSVALCFAGSLMVTTGLYVLDPIECISDPWTKDVIDSYCWVHSTFTIPGEWEKDSSKSFSSMAYPGVTTSAGPGTPIKSHDYYQWVCYILAFQGLLFYIPHLLWKSLEGGKIPDLVIMVKENPDMGVKAFMNCLGHRNHLFYKFVFCELLNFGVVGLQIWMTALTDFTLTEVISFLMANEPLERQDRLARTFPKVSKCEFNTFGPSGQIQNIDALCVLPFNSINEKIYLGMWIWLAFLACLSTLTAVYRMLLLFIPAFRTMLLKQSTKHTDIQGFGVFRESLKVGDWFMLHYLGKNMDLLAFTEFVKSLQKELTKKSLKYT